MIKFRCKKRTAEGNMDKKRPEPTKKDRALHTAKRNGETYTACRTNDGREINIHKKNRKRCQWGGDEGKRVAYLAERVKNRMKNGRKTI